MFIVSVGDRIEVVSAGEIDDADLAQGADGYRQRPLWGPRLIGIREPQDPKERDKLLFASLAGKDYPVLPAYYVPYEQTLPQIRQRALPVSELEKRHPEAKPLVANAVAAAANAGRKARLAAGEAPQWILDRTARPGHGRPVSWLPVDPY